MQKTICKDALDCSIAVYMNNNYQSALVRINKANDAESLLKVEESLERLWNAGIFTRDQFSKLDDILVEKLISIDPYKFG